VCCNGKNASAVDIQKGGFESGETVYTRLVLKVGCPVQSAIRTAAFRKGIGDYKGRRIRRRTPHFMYFRREIDGWSGISGGELRTLRNDGGAVVLLSLSPTCIRLPLAIQITCEAKLNYLMRSGRSLKIIQW
jgi:hypothetical protein